MGRKQPLGRKHKAGTGNNKAAPARRVISKTNLSAPAQPTRAAADAAAQAEQPHADAEVCAWLDGVLARLEPAPRPPAPEQHHFYAYGDTQEEALAALAAKNNLCTCAQGVPSFLCRVRWCWASEVGTCEPRVVPLNCMHSRYCAYGCKCIQWARILDSGRIVCEEGLDHGDGIYTSRHEVISGEHDEVRRKVFYQGDPEIAVRRWPPRRVQFCEGCCCHFGSYIKTCDSENTYCRRAGRSVMVVSEGGDLAVTCVIRCMGGVERRCSRSRNGSGYCNLHDLPDLCVDRATEPEERARAVA